MTTDLPLLDLEAAVKRRLPPGWTYHVAHLVETDRGMRLTLAIMRVTSPDRTTSIEIKGKTVGELLRKLDQDAQLREVQRLPATSSPTRRRRVEQLLFRERMS